MSDKLSVGDFVRLKIGGEAMVIVNADALQSGNWICSWVNRDGQVQMSSISENLLKYIGPSNPTTSGKSIKI